MDTTNQMISDNVKEEGQHSLMSSPNDNEVVEMEEESDFIDMKDAIEVKVDDDNVPMEEEDDDDQMDGNTGVVVTEQQQHDISISKLESHTGPVYSVAAQYDPTKQSLSILSGGGDDKSFLHRLLVQGGGQEQGPSSTSTIALTHVHSDTVACTAFNVNFVSDDGTKTPKLAATGSYDGTIVLYDFDTGTKLQQLEGPSDVEWLCFHPKGGTVLLAGSVTDGTVWMYHIPTSKCMQVFVGHESGVTAGSFTPDGRWALSASSDGTLRVWAPRTGVSKHVFRFGSGSDDGNAAAAAGLTSLAVNGGTDSQLVIVGAEDGTAYVCHIGTKKVVASLRHFEPPLPNAAADEDEEMEYPMSVEAVGFASAAVNPNWVATGGVDGVLKIWDLSNDGQCRQVCRHGEADSDVGGITRLRWHPTLPLVFTSASDGNVRIWDARNGSLLKTLTGHSDMINDMDVVVIDAENEGGRAVVVSGSDDKTVRIYEVDIKEAMASTLAAKVAPLS